MGQFVTPAFVPVLAVLLDRIPASRADVARHLGVTPRTLDAWTASGNAPRAVLVALFMESDYGRQSIDCDLFNRTQMLAGLADCLRRETETLRARIARLERLGDFGSANAPTMSAVAVAAGAYPARVGLDVRADLG